MTASDAYILKKCVLYSISVSRRRRRGVDFSNWVVDEPPANEALALLLVVAGQRRLQLGLVTEKSRKEVD